MIQAMIFDLDGTLVDYQGDFATYLAPTVELTGFSPQQVQQLFAEVNRLMLLEGTRNYRNLVHEAYENLSLAKPEGIDSFIDWIIESYVANVHIRPGAIEMLEYFSFLPKAIITNGPTEMQWAVIRKHGLEQYFRVVVVSGDSDIGVRKPNPKIFQIACERLGVSPENVLMIGDNLEADVLGSRVAGLRAIHIPE